MGGPAFDRQVFVKKQPRERPPSRNVLPGAAVLLLVAALASFATYRYVKAGGGTPSNPTDTAKIKELQTKLKQTEARIAELEKQRHAARATRVADTATGTNARTEPSELHRAMIAESTPVADGHVARVRHSSASPPTDALNHSTVNEATSGTSHNPSPSSPAASRAATELNAQLESAQAASNKKLALLQSDLAANHQEWQATTNRLGNVVGELDTQRNAIQKNQNGVNYLLERAHRSDIAFTLRKGAGLQRVGPISMKLASTSVKGQHYSLRMIVDDKSVELRDRALNEVIEFYTSQSKFPLRLIVSQIDRGQVSGTLAVPFALGQETNNPQFHELHER